VKRKQSLYFPENMLEEISREAYRLDRSLSWVVQRAWRLASTEVARLSATHPQSFEHTVDPERPASSTGAARGAQCGEQAEGEPGGQVRAFLRGKFDRLEQ
jgi:uncharacterized small protein (TIGR04563 family)